MWNIWSGIFKGSISMFFTLYFPQKNRSCKKPPTVNGIGFFLDPTRIWLNHRPDRPLHNFRASKSVDRQIREKRRSSDFETLNDQKVGRVPRQAVVESSYPTGHFTIFEFEKIILPSFLKSTKFVDRRISRIWNSKKIGRVISVNINQLTVEMVGRSVKTKDARLERADFTLQLLMFVTAEKERKMSIIFFLSIFCQLLSPRF